MSRLRSNSVLVGLLSIVLWACSEGTGPQQVVSVEIGGATPTLEVDDSLQLTATARDLRGRDVASAGFVWSSSNDTVASVSAGGKVTAGAEGSAIITAEAQGIKGMVALRVVRPPLPELALEEVVKGLKATPSHLSAPPRDSRLFVVGLDGKIQIVRQGQLLPDPFLDLREKVAMAGEMGMFSLAFHPNYVSNGYFYVNYTDRNGNIRIERYRVSADPNRADPASAKLILEIDPPGWMHFGGSVEFGPDGKMYISTGDGGNGALSQDKGSLIGKILRIDVDAGDPYAIPSDNPFVGQGGARGEVWALGLRNPWRLSIDHRAGLVFTGDVGANHWEEINVAALGKGGLNFGWQSMEGILCHPEPVSDCNRAGLSLPVIAYAHGERGTGHSWGCSVTGGYVYRGSRIRGLRGHYMYADFCKGWIRSFRYHDGEAVQQRLWPLPNVGRIVSFGQDGAGELYLLTMNGSVYRIVPSGGS